MGHEWAVRKVTTGMEKRRNCARRWEMVLPSQADAAASDASVWCVYDKIKQVVVLLIIQTIMRFFSATFLIQLTVWSNV